VVLHMFALTPLTKVLRAGIEINTRIITPV